MTTAIGLIKATRGESIAFALRATAPEYDGLEAVTCDVKVAQNGNGVPSDDAAVVLSIVPIFVAAVGVVGSEGYSAAHWSFSIPPAVSATLEAGNYITDAKVAFADGFVDAAAPLSIKIEGRVTA